MKVFEFAKSMDPVEVFTLFGGDRGWGERGGGIRTGVFIRMNKVFLVFWFSSVCEWPYRI